MSSLSNQPWLLAISANDPDFTATEQVAYIKQFNPCPISKIMGGTCAEPYADGTIAEGSAELTVRARLTAAPPASAPTHLLKPSVRLCSTGLDRKESGIRGRVQHGGHIAGPKVAC